MAQIIEWFQCGFCGRRQRWRAELVGVDVDCQCGRPVKCPELDALELAARSEGTANGTIAALTMSGAAVAAPGYSEAVEIRLASHEAAAASPELQVGAGQPWHRDINFRTLFWTLAALFGLALAIFAAIMAEWPWIVAAVMISPYTFRRWWKCERSWQGQRSLMRAVEETLGGPE